MCRTSTFLFEALCTETLRQGHRRFLAKKRVLLVAPSTSVVVEIILCVFFMIWYGVNFSLYFSPVHLETPEEFHTQT